MTKQDPRRCAWCGAAFELNPGPGRPRRYCKRSHRQRHYESKALAEQRGIGADELLVERAKVSRLHDLLYVLEAACEDVSADLDAGVTEAEDLRQTIAYLLGAAQPLRDAYLEPKADLLG